MRDARCKECGTALYPAGHWVPAGIYLRVDDGSFQRLQLVSGGLLPATLDGHVALYRAAAAPCTCQRRRARATPRAQRVSGTSAASTAAASGAMRRPAVIE
jgi:hypothetical protein